MSVALFTTRNHYDRAKLLEAARRARKRGRAKKAIALYREVLRAEPHNDDLRKRVADLLVRTRQLGAAREHYWLSARNLERRGFAAQAMGVYREALAALPRDAGLWRALADVQAGRGQLVDAVDTLTAGRRRLRSRRQRDAAIGLLSRAHDLDPANLDVCLDLARLLRKTGQRAAARGVLDASASCVGGRDLRRLRLRRLLHR